MKVLDVFSGIGGFSLGLEATGGFETVAFCEIEPYPRKVLAKHWPGVYIHDDIRTLGYIHEGGEPDDWILYDSKADHEIYRGPIDVVTGGFPCQDISLAGKGAGLAGERSGLWRELFRLIGEVRPKYAIMENVSALLGRGLGDVLGDLAEIGYDAEWHCIPASRIGAPHQRDRVWIIAHPNSQRPQGIAFSGNDQPPRQGIIARPMLDRARRQAATELCFAESALGRKADGFSGRVDRLKALGNAVVPQIPELIGRAILKGAAQCHA